MQRRISESAKEGIQTRTRWPSLRRFGAFPRAQRAQECSWSVACSSPAVLCLLAFLLAPQLRSATQLTSSSRPHTFAPTGESREAFARLRFSGMHPSLKRFRIVSLSALFSPRAPRSLHSSLFLFSFLFSFCSPSLPSLPTRVAEGDVALMSGGALELGEGREKELHLHALTPTRQQTRHSPESNGFSVCVCGCV